MTAADVDLDLLPEGITVLEASAGTGKTHRVTTEAVRAVAAGTPLEQMLLVTFTVAATSELRARTWDRLARTATALGAHLGGAAIDTDDELVAELCAGDEGAVRARHRNLADAMASFDGATITTIHGFCHQVLQSLGFAADVERDPTFVEDVRDMLDEVVADLLVRKLHRGTGVTFPLDLARRIAEKATVDPRARIVPEGVDGPGGTDGTRASFAGAVRREMGRRKRAAGVLGYDDLLLRVEEALVEDPDGTVRDRLRRRYSLVIVDEFQDTDAVQWEILERAFGDPPTRLVLVGDPKQAIYAFRGADVHAYLAARRRAGAANLHRLDRSWRADAGVLRGLDSLFGDTALGHDEIRYASTTAAPGREATRIHGLAKPTPVRLRLVGGDRPGLTLTPSSGVVQKDSGIGYVAEDLASDVVALLSQGATYDDPDEGERPLRCGDVAVLVGRNQDALTVREALVRAGVPAVVNGTGSVFGTGAARAWLAVLEAVERPAATGVVRNAALTPLLGWTAAQVDAADERAWDALHDRLHDWHRLLAIGNVAALFEQLSAHTDLPARLLQVEGGERTVTDLRHLASLLHAQAGLGGGAPSLLAWLRERMREVDRDAAQDDRSRRLETDEEAVQVWTIHRSKGLEYPVVYVPFLWVPPPARAEDVLVFHEETSGERVIDVSDPKGPGASERADHARRYLDEEAGGALRLAYVALTRARSQVVLYWVRGHDCHRSPLGRLLLGADRAENDRGTKLRDEDCRSAADLLAQRAGGALAVEPASGASGARLARSAPASPRLRTASFDRTIDRAWRRTSYSALTAAAHDAPDAHAAGESDATDGSATPTGTAPEHDERGLEDERMPEDLPVAGARADAETEARLRAVPSPFGDLGGGATFGTLVHGVLEEVDFAADDLPRQLRAGLGAQYLGDQQIDADALVGGLVAAIETPLGPLVDDLRLRDVRRADRLDELHFELPLVGGDDPTGHVTMQAIADVVSGHLPADDPLAGYGDRLRSPALAAQVRGHLSGSIDVVLRHRDADGQGRYVVIDHKSNWLGVAGEELSAWHYRPSALAEAMVRAHYPLQALLYAVALHRYLRWRLPDHDPARDLGGVLYLFLRGMTGADVPRVDGQPCGVFTWRPPAELVVGLSDVLDRGAP
jgi:exodeoxyribonuclease V beta subunit